MGRSNSYLGRCKRRAGSGVREAYETLNGNMHHGKYQTEPGKEMEMVMRLMLGIVIVIIVGALLSLGLK